MYISAISLAIVLLASFVATGTFAMTDSQARLGNMDEGFRAVAYFVNCMEKRKGI